jgi:hypothetical protein
VWIRTLSKVFDFFFKKASKYIGVARNNSSQKKPWKATLRIDGKIQHLGYFKTETKAAKFVNFVCKKESKELKNPELSEEEEETFTWPLNPKKVAIFLYAFFFALVQHFISLLHTLIKICWE